MLSWIAVRVVRFAGDQVPTARQAIVLERTLPTKGAPARLVTVDGERPSAHAVAALPGRGGHVVITAPLLDVLDDADLRRAVVEHERAHLRHHHATLRCVAFTAAAVNPLLRPVADEVVFFLERWADDEAARATSPAATAEALATISLARLPRAAAALAFGQRNVAGRIDALLTGPPAGRPRGAILAGALAVMAFLAAVATYRACRSTEVLFEGLQRMQRLQTSAAAPPPVDLRGSVGCAACRVGSPPHGRAAVRPHRCHRAHEVVRIARPRARPVARRPSR